MRKLIVPLITSLALVAAPAYADRGYGGGRGGGDYRGHYGSSHHDRGGGSIWPGVAVIGAIAGLAVLAQHSRPVVVEPYPSYPSYPAQPVYVEPVAPARAISQPWYYCQSSTMYYPYAQACPEGWQVLPARPY